MSMVPKVDRLGWRFASGGSVDHYFSKRPGYTSWVSLCLRFQDPTEHQVHRQCADCKKEYDIRVRDFAW
jgi:hypothetical protein